MQLSLLFELLTSWARRDLLVVNVAGESMLPTLRPSDLLFCSRSLERYLHSIVIDEQQLPEGQVARHIKRITGLAGDVRNGIRISPGLAWIEGDNREASGDSRQWGPIRIERLVAVAVAVVRGRKLIDVRPRASEPHMGIRESVIEAWRDWSRGITTRGMVRPDAFGFSPSSVHAYSPTPWAVAHEALDSIGVSTDDVFVDYGCGRGRVLAVALQYPFRRVVGIELLPPLVATARRNLARYRRRCEIFEADATSFALPDDITVVYMFNSFGRDELPHVVRRIRESLARKPRRIRLLTYAIDPLAMFPLVLKEPQVLAARLMLYVLQPVSVS